MKRFLQDGDVGVGVFPEGEEILVSCERQDLGGIGILSLRGLRLQGIDASQSPDGHPEQLFKYGSNATL